MELFLTFLVGGGLLLCGFWLGRAGQDLVIAAALRVFIDEMITAKIINEKKLTSYILKKYGSELDAQ